MPSERRASTDICCVVILDAEPTRKFTTAKARSANSSACQMVITGPRSNDAIVRWPSGLSVIKPLLFSEIHHVPEIAHARLFVGQRQRTSNRVCNIIVRAGCMVDSAYASFR